MQDKWSKTRKCFITNAFQLCFRICHYKGPEEPDGNEIKGAHQLLVYADDVNLLGDNIDTIKKNTQTLIDANKEVGLQVNTQKTKYMLLSHYHNAGQNHDIKMF
jgi:hypothetical protein